MYTGDWISGACPRCNSARAVQKVRADARAFTCETCGHEWAVKRMPLDAEAADIVRRSRQARTETPFDSQVAEPMGSKAARHSNAS
jgi:hypothetical protein